MNHTLGYDRFPAVFWDAADKYKSELSKPMELKRIHSIIESMNVKGGEI